MQFIRLPTLPVKLEKTMPLQRQSLLRKDSKIIKGGKYHERVAKVIPCKMGMYIPCSNNPAMPQESRFDKYTQ